MELTRLILAYCLVISIFSTFQKKNPTPSIPPQMSWMIKEHPSMFENGQRSTGIARDFQTVAKRPGDNFL